MPAAQYTETLHRISYETPRRLIRMIIIRCPRYRRLGKENIVGWWWLVGRNKSSNPSQRRNLSLSLGGPLGGGATLTEAVLEAAGDRLEVGGTAGTGGLPALGLLAPVERTELGGGVTTLSTGWGRGLVGCWHGAWAKRSTHWWRFRIEKKILSVHQRQTRDERCLHIQRQRCPSPLPLHCFQTILPSRARGTHCASACGTSGCRSGGRGCATWCGAYRWNGCQQKILNQQLFVSTYNEGVPCYKR
jgi:hypothetical protein